MIMSFPTFPTTLLNLLNFFKYLSYQCNELRPVLQRIYSKNTDKSLDECRRVQTNVDESQTIVEECRRITRQVQTSLDVSLDECRCRRVQTNVDQCRRIKSFVFNVQEKVTRDPICCCCNYATVGYIGMQIIIIAPDNVLNPHISKSHLPIVSLN